MSQSPPPCCTQAEAERERKQDRIDLFDKERNEGKSNGEGRKCSCYWCPVTHSIQRQHHLHNPHAPVSPEHAYVPWLDT